jgi:hypothetical protein
MEAVSVASRAHIEKQLSARKVESLDMLPRDVRKQIKKEARQIALKDVFGEGHATDRQGQPLEQGLGSASNITQQHIDAYVKNQTERSASGPEPGYEEHLARMRKDLAACEERRRAARAAEDDEED